MTPSWERSTRTGRSRAWPATSSCWEPPHGGSAGWSQGPFGWSTPRGRRHRFPSGWGRPLAAPRSSPTRCPIFGPGSASGWSAGLRPAPHHSFPLGRVPTFPASRTVEEVLGWAVLTPPRSAAGWRWNLNRALAVLRMRGGRKNPPAIQRMESDDLMVAVFPTLAACQENVAPGPIEIPDHPLVRQTLDDCLHEAMDVDGLRDLLGRIESGRVQVVTRDTVEPSVLAHEILNGRPFTYLDDAPLEERRSRAVQLRRGLPVEARDLGRLDPDAIERVREEVWPDPRDADQLHDLLISVLGQGPNEEWGPWFDELVGE